MSDASAPDGPAPKGSAPEDSAPENSAHRGPVQKPPSPNWLHLLRLSAAVTGAGYAAQRFRSLQISGAMLALGGVSSVVLVAQVGAADVADIVALRIMAYSCWLYGGLGLWVLLSPKALQDEPSLLSKMRGQVIDSNLVRGLGIARRLTIGMLVASMPGLIAALAVSASGGAVGQRVALLFVSAFYLASLGMLLGAVGAISTRALPRAPRTCAALVVLLPFILSFSSPEIPSIPGLYSWALGRMLEWGAAA